MNAALERAQRSDDNPVLAQGQRRMLFAAESFPRALRALQHACELSSRWRGTLYVLHVAAQPQQGAAGVHEARKQASIARAALRSIRLGRARSAFDLPVSDHVLIKHGDFAGVVAETARELDAELVMIAGAERRKGVQVARMARAAGVPVLVARRGARSGAILAATDLCDPACGELRHAARFAQQQQGRLAFLHNVQPLVHASATALGHCQCTVVEPSPQSLADRRARLQALAAFFGVRADALVVTRPSAEDAILEAARASGADVIVVGARKQSWLERLFGTALAARIVDRSTRSVLVAPIGDTRDPIAMPAL